mgnify:CR=1 FL=1
MARFIGDVRQLKPHRDGQEKFLRNSNKLDLEFRGYKPFGDPKKITIDDVKVDYDALFAVGLVALENFTIRDGLVSDRAYECHYQSDYRVIKNNRNINQKDLLFRKSFQTGLSDTQKPTSKLALA